MYSQNVANTYIASSGLSFWCFNSVLIVEVLVQKVFALDSTVYNANLLAKAKAISNDVRNMLASFPRSTPPASMDNVKEGTAFSNWIIPLRGKPMPPLVSIKNPILQLHPSFTNLGHGCWSGGWTLRVGGQVAPGGSGFLFGRHGNQTNSVVTKFRLELRSCSRWNQECCGNTAIQSS